MKMSLTSQPIEKNQKNCLIICMFEGGELSPSAKKVDILTQGYLSHLYKKGLFNGKIGQTLPLFDLGAGGIQQVLLIGGGKVSQLSPMGFRKLMVSVAKAVIQYRFIAVTSHLAELEIKTAPSLAWKVRQITEAFFEAAYRFDAFKTEKEPTVALKEWTVAISDPKEEKSCQKAMKEGEAISEGVIFTKNLANSPSNICTPSYLADQAKALAKQYSTVTVKVLGEKEMKKLGMGALLAVSQGSAEEAKLICLEYHGGGKKEAPIALIGKGVTFDTGGNSLKPADSMVGMKYDMCGAATVLGTIKAVAELKLPLSIVGIIPAVENMPGGSAYKPEDILTSLSGQTIEVISTDAEGRLALADALTYCERYRPDVVIDIATLTGAVVIALGFHATGLLSNDETLAENLIDAGVESNDRAWQLPLWEEYQEQIKSPFADMANTGGRSAGTITAAAFLSRFAKKFRWAHLDVAGTAAMMMGTQERMASGRPVPLLVQYLINRKSDKA